MNPTAVFAEKLLLSAISHQASDIHFYPFPNKTNIYFRIHGKRTIYKTMLTSQYELLLTYYKFTAGMDIGEVRKPQDGAISHQVDTEKFALRLSTLPVNQLESLAIRILPQEETIPINQLFLFPNQLSILKKWITNPSGLILLTGPTGSGKTTTLYALLQSLLEESSYQTITLEDPIEKKLNDILQVQINEKAGITYQSGLKAALRHDPDIIMVGEIRDQHTAKFAFDASLTGHLVLSTLHAKNTIGTIHRLFELGLSNSDLAQSLIGIASIQLLPININQSVQRRAAILELLDGPLLENTLKGLRTSLEDHRHSFNYLRKKAYAYGFISEDTYYSF
ncbi:competence protein [Ornithinibacillus sp. L9]|uniref:Competence protein n=1 Tax=Ornithinibacillus caprae TaxID=2678566 RepID=A0A6N8FHC0_9BACI|nr:competence type IV pilus ATPase ComGA [Ornithinibacillus caprae]MUK87139.1 competence protein [Ornithinibacillus caprae]